jgi:DNA-binding MarR family transcriptional regulator
MDNHALAQSDLQPHQTAAALAAPPRQSVRTDRTPARPATNPRKVDGWSSAALDDLGLDPYAFRAYHTIARRAGADGACYESVANMAKRCGMSASRMQRALRDLERRGLVERIELPGQPSEYRRPTPEVNLAPHAEALRTPVPRTGRAGTTYRGTPVPRTDKGLALEGLPLKEEKNSDERMVRGASPVASPPAERAHPSKELDIDQEPARKPLAPDAVDMDPRLHPEHALMDRMNGKPTAMQEEIAARSFFVRLLGAANAKNPQVQPRMRAWHQQYGEKYIESVWDEARNRPDPKNARKTPLYYLVDALNGQFFPRAAAERDIALAAAREPDPALEPGALVTLPNGEQRVLDTVAGVWSYLEGVPGVVRTADLRPVLEARP